MSTDPDRLIPALQQHLRDTAVTGIGAGVDELAARRAAKATA